MVTEMNSFGLPGKSGIVEGYAVTPIVEPLPSLRPERNPAATEIVLFLLDLAKTTGQSSFLQLARLAAEYLAEGWSRPATSVVVEDAEHRSSLTHDLSRTAFALAEAWKVTHDTVYRDAGLDIIHYLSEAPPAAAFGIGHRFGTKS